MNILTETLCVQVSSPIEVGNTRMNGLSLCFISLQLAEKWLYLRISVLCHFAARNVKKLSVLFKVLFALKMLLANLQYEHISVTETELLSKLIQ